MRLNFTFQPPFFPRALLGAVGAWPSGSQRTFCLLACSYKMHFLTLDPVEVQLLVYRSSGSRQHRRAGEGRLLGRTSS